MCHLGSGKKAETHKSICSPEMLVRITKSPNIHILIGAQTALIPTLLPFNTYYVRSWLQDLQGGYLPCPRSHSTPYVPSHNAAHLELRLSLYHAHSGRGTRVSRWCSLWL